MSGTTTGAGAEAAVRVARGTEVRGPGGGADAAARPARSTGDGSPGPVVGGGGGWIPYRGGTGLAHGRADRLGHTSSRLPGDTARRL
ncbi:hypothetical protein AB0O29_33350, partial [Streptomyces sp. NPDC089915]